jgi:D-beta-D-heptose 7-phosphate kinase/D-beta-D-heptose 1-phosphate adenosyltransferase
MKQLETVLHTLEHEWPLRRVLVVGDVMLDRYIRGEVVRISPEAPVPVVRVVEETHRPGGAANVAVNLARLGARAVVAGFVGADEGGEMLRAGLREQGVEARLVLCRDFPTTSKVRVLGGGQQMLRLDRERTDQRQVEEYEQLWRLAREALETCDALVLSDYAKGGLTIEGCRELIGAARAAGKPVLVDPKHEDFSRYWGATTVCPNLSELRRAAKLETEGLDAALDAAERMVTELGLEFLTVTLGEMGIALVRPGQRELVKAEARQVFDVSGAGDTVIATLALAACSGLTPEVGVEVANAAAGIVVGKVGTAPVEKHELIAALTPEIGLHAQGKVVDRAELQCRLMLWRQNHERIVFTNGCFDLLHVGHVALVERARGFGARLVVAMNSDASVRRLKGPGRPIVGEQERARLLAALAAVDAVVVFDEKTPLELILDVRPDVLVKGGDYAAEDVVGAREVQSWGGQVEIVPLVEGISTTRLIAALCL